MTAAHRLALFDLDNTLVDRQSIFDRWARHFVAQHGLGPDAFDVLHAADRDGFATREAVFGELLDHVSLRESVEDLVQQYRQEYLELFVPDPVVLAALGRLRTDGWRIGVVTNGPPTQYEKMRRTGLLSQVDGYCISSEIGAAKPAGEIFVEAARRCLAGRSFTPGGTWMTGDAPATDIAGGVACGMRTIWMRRGRTWSRTEFTPDLVADTLSQAVEHLLMAGARGT